MKGPIDCDLKMVALWYLNQVKRTLGGGGGGGDDGGKKYRTFCTLLGEFRDGKISVPDLISSVKELLIGHDDLLQGFTTFLPYECKATEPEDEYEITAKAIEPKDHTMTSVNGDGDYVGYPHPKRQKICEDVSKGFRPKRQRRRRKISDDLMSQIQQATDLVNKVRGRFEDGDVVYKSFLDALCGYKKGEGKISISQVEKELKLLFCAHPDLLIELSRYTADFYGANQATEYEQSRWESMKKGKKYECYGKPREEDEYETMLFMCEDDRCKTDVAIGRFVSAIENMELFVQSAKKTGSGPITDLKEHFTPINLRSIEELYKYVIEDEVYDYGVDMIDQLLKNPIKAGDIVLNRLKQKLEELKHYGSQAAPIWAEAYKVCHEKLGSDSIQGGRSKSANQHISTSQSMLVVD